MHHLGLDVKMSVLNKYNMYMCAITSPLTQGNRIVIDVKKVVMYYVPLRVLLLTVKQNDFLHGDLKIPNLGSCHDLN